MPSIHDSSVASPVSKSCICCCRYGRLLVRGGNRIAQPGTFAGDEAGVYVMAGLARLRFLGQRRPALPRGWRGGQRRCLRRTAWQAGRAGPSRSPGPRSACAAAERAARQTPGPGASGSARRYALGEMYEKDVAAAPLDQRADRRRPAGRRSGHPPSPRPGRAPRPRAGRASISRAGAMNRTCAGYGPTAPFPQRPPGP